MSSDKELFSQYFKPTEVPELSLENVSSILPFDVIGMDTSNGNRNVNIATGNFIKPPKSITNLKEAIDFYGEGNVPAELLQTKIKLPEGKELATVGANLLGGGKEALVDKDRPKNIQRIIAGFQDFIDPTKDRDKLGGLYKEGEGYDPYGGVTLTEDIDPNELKEFSPYQQKLISDKLKDQFAEPKTALEKTEEYLEAIQLASDPLREIARKDRRAAAIDAQLQYALSEPVRQFFNERAARTRLGIEKEFAGFKESLPSAQQAIMSEKQKQQYLASSGFAEEAKAIAEQLKAAKRDDPRSYGQRAIG